MAWYGDRAGHARAARGNKKTIESVFESNISNKEKMEYFVNLWKEEIQKKKPDWRAVAYYRRNAYRYGHTRPIYIPRFLVKK